MPREQTDVYGRRSRSQDLLHEIDAALDPAVAKRRKEETNRVLESLDCFRLELAYERGFHDGRHRRLWRWW